MDIAKALESLNDLVSEGVIEAYALGGAVAATFYLEPLATQDVDVFVRLQPVPGKFLLDPAPIVAFYSKRGYEMEGEYAMIEGWPVQFLAPPGRLGEEAMDAAVEMDLGGVSLKVLTAEHLAAIALGVGRLKDKDRVRMFLKSPGFNRSRFEEIVHRHELDVAWNRLQKEEDFKP